MTIDCLGVSFRTAPLEVREILAYPPAAAEALLSSLRKVLAGAEVLLLSTCNRTEFYVAAREGERAADRLLDVICADRPETSALREACTRYRLDGVSAVRHLCEVACGLDSAILGDVHVVGQLKEAVRVAVAADTLGPALERVTVHALRAAKRARTHTSIGRGAASIGAALAAMLGAGVPGPILVLGAGDVGRDVGRHLAKRGLGPLLFANRTPERALELARECGGRPVEWNEIAVALRAAAFVVAATAAPSPVLSRAALDEVAAERGEAAPTIVDLGVPRNVEPGSRLMVVDIDAVRDRQGEANRVRQSAVPAVREIVGREVGAWHRWRRTRAIDDLVRRLYRDLDAHSSVAVGTLADRYGVDAAEAERVVRRSMRPLLHEHVRRLRAVAAWDSGNAGLPGELSSGGAGT